MKLVPLPDALFTLIGLPFISTSASILLPAGNFIASSPDINGPSISPKSTPNCLRSSALNCSIISGSTAFLFLTATSNNCNSNSSVISSLTLPGIVDFNVLYSWVLLIVLFANPKLVGVKTFIPTLDPFLTALAMLNVLPASSGYCLASCLGNCATTCENLPLSSFGPGITLNFAPSCFSTSVILSTGLVILA